MTAGRLIYVMGPSGAGKDSVIACARRMGDPTRLTVAHRYITRPPRLDAENYVALSEAEFAARRRAGWFALCWNSHGLGYGIGREIDLWLASGAAVLVNGSRAYLAEAVVRYPDLLPVLVTAAPEIRHSRLLARKRESANEIAARLDRRIAAMPDHTELVTIDNSGALEKAGQALLACLFAAQGAEMTTVS